MGVMRALYSWLGWLGAKEALGTGPFSYQELAHLFPPPGLGFHGALYLYLTG